jgi:hypothetical protein
VRASLRRGLAPCYVVAAALGRDDQACVSKGGQRSGSRVVAYIEFLRNREDAWYAADQLRRLDASAQDRCQLLMQRHRRVMVEHPRSVPLSGIPPCVWVYPGVPRCTVTVIDWQPWVHPGTIGKETE